MKEGKEETKSLPWILGRQIKERCGVGRVCVRAGVCAPTQNAGESNQQRARLLAV